MYSGVSRGPTRAGEVSIMPRPSKLTETAQAAIRAALEAGNTRAAAAQAAGIAPDTLRTWMRQGEQQATGRHRTLARTVEQAEAQAARSRRRDTGSLETRRMARSSVVVRTQAPGNVPRAKVQGGNTAEDTTIRIIYADDAETAQDVKPWTRSNNGGTHHDNRRTL
jgi:transposase-like protein